MPHCWRGEVCNQRKNVLASLNSYSYFYFFGAVLASDSSVFNLRWNFIFQIAHACVMECSGKNCPRSQAHIHCDLARESFLCFMLGPIDLTLHLLSETEKIDFQNLLPTSVVINIQNISSGMPWWNRTLPTLIINNPLTIKFWCYSQLRWNNILARGKKGTS